MVLVKHYNSYFTGLGSGTFDLSDASAGAFKILLVTSTYTFSKLHDFRNDITNEVSGTGYTAGGNNLTSVLLTQNDTDDRAEWDFDNPSWPASTITARGAVIYKNVGTAATDNLICFIDFEQDESSNNTELLLQLTGIGLLVIRQG